MFLFPVLTGVALLLLDLASGQAVDPCQGPLDFEDPSQHCLVVFPTSKGSITFSQVRAKHGNKSLKWESDAVGTSRLRYERPSSAARIKGNSLTKGGIKMWIYKETATKGKKMSVWLRDTTRKVRVGSFNVDLGFKGWRAIWVAYSECKQDQDSLIPPAEVTRLDFVLTHKDTIYIDLLDFVNKMSWQSRDKIVPPFTKFGSLYDSSNSWQRSYHWSQKTPDDPSRLSIDTAKTLSLTHIESRLKNWYCDERQTTYDFTGKTMQRWKKLKKSFDDAHEAYDKLKLNFTTMPGSSTIVISGPPLFCRNSERGTREYNATDPTRKFSYVMMRILLPLALEFYLKSRADELTRTVTEETLELNSGDESKINGSLRRICGRSPTIQKELNDSLNTIAAVDKVRRSLDYINKVRLQRIINLLDYIEDQGWADGSAIGSLEFEMNQDGAGYMHTLFLLKESLHQSGNQNRLLNLIKTAKWYNDFGEVYQKPQFEYKGTTADRMITIMIFRLMIVLTMPTSTNDEIKARQRDMDALKKWMNNALDINKAFGGVIKPDYTAFHHKAFYASAYAPHALHTAAQVQYLLEGTNFALSTTAKSNLREALKTLSLTAVKYSTPVSVGGRAPDFSNKVLIDILPAYAYISVSHPAPPLSSPPARGITVPAINADAVKIFSRLYQPSDVSVEKYLEDGRVHRGKSYMNSLGSLNIMSAVYSRAPSAEPSPEGHWTKNFAALSVHRRKDWVVTVKGFNRFVWDFESSTKKANPENAHGIFASHGSMLIANSEEALEAHDVNNGWDWTKTPGATTMSLTLLQTRLKKARNFSPLSSAGGVTYQGPEPKISGVFGMDFHQPNYQFFDKNHPHPNIKLHFKKSVFFFQNVLVCLGSNITIKNGPGIKAQTTLFQDKLVRGASSFFIKVDGIRKDSSSPPLPGSMPYSPSGRKRYTTLTDTKGNSYYIPGSSASSLKVHFQNQISETPAAKPSNGVYATAWLEHSSPNGTYQYAILVNTPSYIKGHTVEDYWNIQNFSNTLYQVLQQDDKAHVVKFDATTERYSLITSMYGYVIFQSTSTLPSGGLIKAVSNQARIMVEENSRELYLSISYPDLNFPGSKVLKTSDDIKQRELFDIESHEIQIEVTLTQDVDKILAESPKVYGSPDGYVPTVRVESSAGASPPPNKGNKIVFANLKNGFSVEIKLNK